MKDILCFGDSNTYGWNPIRLERYAPDVRWPGVLQKALGNEYHVVEEGCGYRTAAASDELEPWVSGLAYFEPCLRSHCPLDAVIIMLGTNDMKRRFMRSARDIANSVGLLAGKVGEVLRFEQKVLPKILIVSPIHIGQGIKDNAVNYEDFNYEHGIETSKKLAFFYKQVAEKYGCEFMDAADYAEPSIEDCVHMTPDGHKALGEAIAKKIKEMLEDA